jgi:hypothetical protein
MVIHQVIGLTRINMKVNLNSTTVSYNSYNWMHNQLEHNVKIQNKRQGALVKYIVACLDPKLS